MDGALRDKLARAIAQLRGEPFTIGKTRPVGGGCIHQCFAIDSDNQRYFLKLSEPEHAATLTAEADGLGAIRATGVRAPDVIAQGKVECAAFLLLEYLAFAPTSSPRAQRELGRALAGMHQHTGERYGWPQDNFIGLTPQSNTWHSDWTVFWDTQRLRPQLELASRNGYGNALDELGDALLAALPALLDHHHPTAALLHGDLWSGNAAALADGTSAIFDPAVYYGDPEADLAMTESFGGFTPSFYDGYREVRALDGGYALRKHVYNLYHVLNHLNLFGGAYLQQSRKMMQRLLAEVR